MTHLIPKFNIRISTIKNYTYNINVPICFLQNVKQQVDRQTDRRTDTAWQHIAALAAWLGCSRAANRLRSRYCKTVKVKVWTLVIAPLIWVRLVTSSAYNLGSGSWLAWANGALCSHPLTTLTDSWTHGAASRHTIAPISYYTGLHPVAVATTHFLSRRE